MSLWLHRSPRFGFACKSLSTGGPAYAEVVVAAGNVRGDQTFHYRIPNDFRGDLCPGQMVLVPFGSRQLYGVVVGIAEDSPVDETRDVLELIDKSRVIDSEHLRLARWLAQHYGCPLFTAVELVAPPSLARHLHTVYTATGRGDKTNLLTGNDRRLLTVLLEDGELSAAEIQSKVGKTAATRGLDRMVGAGYVNRHVSLRFPEPATERLVVGMPLPDGESTNAVFGRAHKQQELWEYLARVGVPVAVPDLMRSVSASGSVLRNLVDRGLARIDHRWLLPYILAGPLDLGLRPQSEDDEAWSLLQSSMGRTPPETVLVQGEELDRWRLYASAINSEGDKGRQSIVVTPDATTAIEFSEWLAARSGLVVADSTKARTDAQRVALWRSARSGELDVVVGTRSAIFAPFTRLGLVIVDREEDRAHKNPSEPRYHVSSCAKELIRISRCMLLLGTETPRVATFYATETGQSRLILAGSDKPRRDAWLREGCREDVDRVVVVDTRRASTAGRYGVISRQLYMVLRSTVEANGRAVLYVNRRGSAALTICRDCGYVAQCPRCSRGLVQHRQIQQLICHICNWRGDLWHRCPTCDAGELRLWGYGSEAVAEAVTHLLPRARVVGIDSDRSVHELEASVASFGSGDVDVLVGTQRMLRFGSLLRADLLGVVQADIGLQFPDFLAPERVFLNLMRLQRLVHGPNCDGRTIVQTVMPEHYVLDAFQKGSYARFFRAEMDQRRSEGLPPLSSLVKATFAHVEDSRAEEEARRTRLECETVLSANADVDVEILGPAPAFVRRQRQKYLWQLLLIGADVRRVLPIFHRGWTLDADPQELT